MDISNGKLRNGPNSGCVLNVVVIGGSSGIGSSIVECFASKGHRILATFYSNEQKAHLLSKKYPTVEYCFLDQGDLDSVEQFKLNVEKWLSNISEQYIDALINNAALGSATVVKYVQSKLSSRKDVDEWNKLSQFRKQALEDEALMKVNSLGPLWVTDILLPLLRSPQENDSIIPKSRITRRNYATIIFMGSVGGSIGVFPEYRASDLMSKSAVSYLSKHLAAKYVHSHIDVFCLAPGATDTEMFRRSTLDTLADPIKFLQEMPKSRLIEPKEVAQAVYSLTTEPWARIFHGGVLDASLGLGTRPGVQTESTVEKRSTESESNGC